MNPALMACFLAAPVFGVELAPVPVSAGQAGVAPIVGVLLNAPLARASLTASQPGLLPPLSLPIALAVAPAPLKPTLLRRIESWLSRAPLSARPLSIEHDSAMQSLHTVHGLLAGGDLQGGLDKLEDLFTGRRAREWYRDNPEFDHYQRQGFAYYRHAEQALMSEFERGVSRADDPALVASAKAGPVAGHAYRETAPQERDSPWCAYHALLNAIKASVGLSRPVETPELVAYAKRRLDRDAIPGMSEASLRRAEVQLGIVLRVRAGRGLSTEGIVGVVKALGGTARVAALPATEAELHAALGSGEEWLLYLRFFHRRYPLAAELRKQRGHDYEELPHEAYLLGAFPHEGGWLYMVQDSGLGKTSFYTFSELRALTTRAEVVRFRAKVNLGDGSQP